MKKDTVYAIYFARVLFSRNFASRVLLAKLTTREKIFTSDPDAWMQLAYTVHVHGAWYYITSLILTSPFIALFDRELNHSQECLKVLIREKLDSQNIWHIYSMWGPFFVVVFCLWTCQLKKNPLKNNPGYANDFHNTGFIFLLYTAIYISPRHNLEFICKITRFHLTIGMCPLYWWCSSGHTFSLLYFQYLLEKWQTKY